MLLPTAPESNVKNGKVEFQHQTFAYMMKTMLLGTNLDRSYWSDALLRAVYIKSYLSRAALTNNITLFKLFTGNKTDLSHLKTFSSIIHVKHPGVINRKLDTSCNKKRIFWVLLQHLVT